MKRKVRAIFTGFFHPAIGYGQTGTVIRWSRSGVSRRFWAFTPDDEAERIYEVLRQHLYLPKG